MAEPEFPGQEEGEALAAELALGVLAGEDRAQALRRVLADPDFARDVEAWRERFAPMLGAVPGTPPPATLWPRIDAAVGAREAGNVVKRLERWRALAVASTAVAASLGAFLLLRPADVGAPQPGAPVMVAQLSPDNAGTALLAAWHSEEGVFRITPAALTAPAGRSPELWLIPGDGKPRSLGVIKASGQTEVAITAELRPLVTGAATLAITIEPLGGSPTGQPTGPIVASGKMSTI